MIINLLGILRFFGNVARDRIKELLETQPKVFDRLFSNIESSDLTIVGVSLDTLGIIGLSNEGKCALYKTGKFYVSLNCCQSPMNL